MAPRKYSLLEQEIVDVFRNEKFFTFNDVTYEVALVGKPRPKKGECKTDVYVLGIAPNGDKKELKISVKSESTNELQENKFTPQRAKEYFGDNWKNIISESAKKIHDKFLEQKLIFGKGKYPTLPNSITLGWKLEIAIKERKLSVRTELTDQEIRDYVYKGTNLPEDKKNVKVGGNFIIDGGVAEYILQCESGIIRNTQQIIDSMRDIDQFAIVPTFLIFTANNLRTTEDKTDGKRNLAVRVDWSIKDGKLDRTILFDEPLCYTGHEWKSNIYLILNELGVTHPNDMDIINFNDPKIFLP